MISRAWNVLMKERETKGYARGTRSMNLKKRLDETASWPGRSMMPSTNLDISGRNDQRINV